MKFPKNLKINIIVCILKKNMNAHCFIYFDLLDYFIKDLNYK